MRNSDTQLTVKGGGRSRASAFDFLWSFILTGEGPGVLDSLAHLSAMGNCAVSWVLLSSAVAEFPSFWQAMRMKSLEGLYEILVLTSCVPLSHRLS